MAQHRREEEVKVAPVDSNVVVLRNPARLMPPVVLLNVFLGNDVPAALEDADCVEVLLLGQGLETFLQRIDLYFTIFVQVGHHDASGFVLHVDAAMSAEVADDESAAP